jgi:arylsulfatase A-like enzyme
VPAILNGERLRIPLHRASVVASAWTLILLVGPAESLDAGGVLPSPSAPNILIFVTDDQPPKGTMHMMPAVNRWFSQGGRKFPNGMVTTPLCCPSRASIFSGRYVHNHRVLGNQRKQAHRFDQRKSMQRFLDAAGYQTAIAGKFLNNWDLTIDPSYWDRWSIFAPPRASSGYGNDLYNIGNRGTGGHLERVGEYSTDFLKRRAVEYLRSFEDNETDPWLLYVAPFAPHSPYIPPARHRNAPVGKWNPPPSVPEKDRSDKPNYVRDKHFTTKDGLEIRRKQLRTLKAVDGMVDAVMKNLVNLAEVGDTLAFFISDNGYLWAHHGILGKRVPYTESIEIPFYMRWPGHVPGADDTRMAANVDIAPTVFDAVGINPPYQIDGWSLLRDHRRHRAFFEYFPDFPGVPRWNSVRTSGAQYVEYYRPDGSLSAREFYDLRKDPFQLRNLWGDKNKANNPVHRTVRLKKFLNHDRNCGGTSGAAACP